MGCRFAVCLLLNPISLLAFSIIALFIHNTHNIDKVSIMGNVYISKVTKAGQISIPKQLRADMGLKEAEYVSMEPRAGSVLMRKVASSEDPFEYFGRLAKEKGITPADVDKAIREVRASLMKERYGI